MVVWKKRIVQEDASTSQHDVARDGDGDGDSDDQEVSQLTVRRLDQAMEEEKDALSSSDDSSLARIEAEHNSGIRSTTRTLSTKERREQFEQSMKEDPSSSEAEEEEEEANSSFESHTAAAADSSFESQQSPTKKQRVGACQETLP